MAAAVTSFTPVQRTTTWWKLRRPSRYCCVCAPHVSTPSPQSPWMFHSSHVSFYTFTAHLLLLSLTLAPFPLHPPHPQPALFFSSTASEGRKSTFVFWAAAGRKQHSIWGVWLTAGSGEIPPFSPHAGGSQTKSFKLYFTSKSSSSRPNHQNTETVSKSHII